MKKNIVASCMGLWLVATALAQGPTPSSLRALPGDLVIGPAYHDQQSPAIAQGGTSFLAVWADQRAGGSGSDIYAVRLDSDGNPLDAVPFVVSQAAGDQVMPRVVWNGTNWLVVWESQQPTQFYWVLQVMAARVSPQGAVLDALPIRVTPYQNSQTLMFTAASDGTNWLVVAEGSGTGEAAISGFRISPAGKVLDPDGVVIVPETYYLRFGLEAGFAGDEFVVLWTEWNATGLDDIYAFRLTPSAQKLDASPITVAASTDYDVNPRLATDATNFFIVYERYNTCCGTGGRVFGTRVTHQGVVRDPAGLDISGDVGITTGRKPCVAWDGANWSVAWFIPGISVARVTPSGTILNKGGLQIDGGSSATKEEPEIAPSPGGGARVVWTDYRAGGLHPKDIYSAAVSSAGQPAGGACISLAAPSQLAPRLASNGQGFLAVFLSAVSGGQRVLAQRLDAMGNPVDAQPFQIAALGPNIYNPSVAGNGSTYLVVWEDRGASTVYGRRVRSDGTVLDANPLAIMPGSTPDVASVGDIFLVVDSHAPGNPQNRFIYSTRLRAGDGALLDASPVAAGGNFAILPRVSSLNGRWLAVWEGHPTHDDTVGNVYAAFIETNGASGPQFAITLDGYYVRFHYRPSIAAGIANALVLWTDPRFGNSDWGIFGRRVLPDGTVLDSDGPGPAPNPPVTMPATYPGFAVTMALNNQDWPAVSWNGLEYVAAWEDARVNSFFVDGSTDIFATRVSGGGAVLEPSGFAFANSPLPEVRPALAGANGISVCATSSFQDQPPYAAYRVGVSTLISPNLPRPILQAASAGSALVLSWPTNAAGFGLQTAPLTGGAPTWVSVIQPIVTNAGNCTVTVPVTGVGALFRLSR